MDVEKQYIKYLAPGFNRDLVLEDLMTTYGQDVWNFAFFLTRRADAADDISQDVFLIVYNRLYTFRGESSIKTWILSITRNKALNYLKSAFIRKVTLIDTMLHFSGQSPSAEQVVLDHISSRAIWEQVLKLPLKFREVIILNYHFELSVDQIAATLQISEGTVKSRLHRAKKKMSVLLDSKREGV
ncbi:RNA polymerase subunit sigma-70 [Paenibacillus sp. FSL H8-0548]|nr:RNA polymerase subunit sigma-70 [Paenibacillus sp. FSL H8-0548]